MIFSDSEREYYRQELEAACKAGDMRRTRRLIDQIRLLGEIRETVPKIQAPKEKDREDKPVINSGGLLEFIKNMELPEDLPTIDINKIGTPLEDKMWEDILDADMALTDRVEMPFRGVLQQGFRDSGWTW